MITSAIGKRFFGLIAIILFVLFSPAVFSHEKKDPKKLVKEYNNLLAGSCPNPHCSSASEERCKLGNLTGLINDLLAAPISDPRVLQKFKFADSYECIQSLENSPPPRHSETVCRWKNLLIDLDNKAYQTNRFFARPSAKWVIQKGKTLTATPTPRMREGYITREEKTIRISRLGRVCGESQKGCEKLRYVLLKCLVRGFDDPEIVRERLHAFPPVKANRRLTRYWEVPLEKDTMLLRRNYRLKPLPGYEGNMENYHQLAFRDKQRIVILEVNARVGKFILRTDNAAIYIKSPPYGVSVALLFTGKYAMEGFFRAIIGNKQVEEPMKVLAILRQYIENTDKGVDHAVEAGIRDYQRNQKQ